MLSLVLLSLILWGTIVFVRNVHEATEEALTYKVSLTSAEEILPKLAVVVPAYNEAVNIEDCVVAVLKSTDAIEVEVWVVDDQSNDETLTIVQALQQELHDPRLKIFAGGARPAEEVWVGKNWACAQAVQQIRSEFLLFLDADVRLQPGAIAAALRAVKTEQIDLLTLLPTIECGCWGEWLAQPLITSLLAAGLRFAQVNNPDSETVFAVGPFMLFRRSAYDQIGGHKAVAGEVVEDVELARRIQQKGLRLRYGLGQDLATVRMYRSTAALWEGWTKNWYLGSGRNLVATLYTALIALWTCTGPWLGLGWVLVDAAAGLSLLKAIALLLSLASISLHYQLRRDLRRLAAIPPRYWWLTGFGGIFVAAIALASIIKTETGWGWTWRGRSLKQS